MLQAYLPEPLSRQLNWATLTLLDGTFIDEALRESESDLLFEIEHAGGPEPLLVYILFEHQSSPDAWRVCRTQFPDMGQAILVVGS